jgi:hypothetical protein
VENGGDCYLDVQEDIKMGVYAGSESPFTDRMALRFPADRFPLAVCTSSGTIGHSLSFGRADMVTVIAKDCALADAAATALANLVDRPFAIKKALDRAARISGVEGCLVLMGDKMGAWGDIEVIPA